MTRRRSYAWTVIVAVVLLAIMVIFWALERVGTNNESSNGVDQADATDGTANGSDTRAPLQDYLQFAATAGAHRTDVDEKYMVDGLRKLAGALGTLNLGSPELQVDLRVAAEHIVLNPVSTATTESVRHGLIAAADAIETGRHDGDNLRRLAESIRSDLPLLDQQVTVHTFFQESAKVIQRTSGQT